MTPNAPAVVALKTITLLLGGLITYFAYRAYDRSGIDALGYLALGFAIVTVGSLLAGVVDQTLAYDASVALLVESAMTAAGFAVIVYSLYAR